MRYTSTHGALQAPRLPPPAEARGLRREFLGTIRARAFCPAVCAATLTTAVAFLHRQTTGWSQARVRLVRARPELHAAEWAIEAAMLAGDVEGLQAAARRWWAACLYDEAIPLDRNQGFSPRKPRGCIPSGERSLAFLT